MNYEPRFFARRDTDYKASYLQFPGETLLSAEEANVQKSF